ncbi:hypothetical protein CIHG_10537 [Coccidioides immitis H538.4]|uniref:Uncharacterized protein n=1 Tax=Coccidioides immitis H538.4 TaxID=396776 RepID=A0A0J8S783_COCIT|nr:hypothetical protein CIHG_10537 [Coccidioides immitis H538.4]
MPRPLECLGLKKYTLTLPICSPFPRGAISSEASFRVRFSVAGTDLPPSPWGGSSEATVSVVCPLRTLLEDFQTRWSAPPRHHKHQLGTYNDEEDVEEEAAPPAKTTVPADTFVLRWPAANPYSPISGGGRGEAAGSGLFGREFGRLRGALVA